MKKPSVDYLPSIQNHTLANHFTRILYSISRRTIHSADQDSLYHHLNGHHINTAPAMTAASRAPVALSNVAAPPAKVATGPATLLTVPAVGAGMGLTPFGFGAKGIGYGGIGILVLTLAKSGCAGRMMAAVVDVNVVFEVEELVAGGTVISVAEGTG